MDIGGRLAGFIKADIGDGFEDDVGQTMRLFTQSAAPIACLKKQIFLAERKMKPLTNFTLVTSFLWVALLVGLVFTWKIFGFPDSTQQLALLALGAFVFYLVVYTAASMLIRRNTNVNNIWLQPVSIKTGRLVTNVVVFLWLCVVLALLVFILIKLEKARALLVLVLFVASGIGLGKLIASRMAHQSLLPFGISFLVVLITTIWLA